MLNKRFLLLIVTTFAAISILTACSSGAFEKSFNIVPISSSLPIRASLGVSMTS